jgi:hypothetical protein
MKFNDSNVDIKKVFSESNPTVIGEKKLTEYTVYWKDGKMKARFLVEQNAKSFALSILDENEGKVWIRESDNYIFFEGFDWKQEVLKESEEKIVVIEKNEEGEPVFDRKKEELLNKFLDYSKEFLKISKLPKVNILEKRKEGMTAGAYSPEENEVWVYGKNRALADVLRSVAHELVHHKQNETGEIEKYERKDVGGKIEDDANSIAGQIIKSFGKIPEFKFIYDL